MATINIIPSQSLNRKS